METLASIRLTLQYETSIIPTSYTLSLKPMTPWDPPKKTPQTPTPLKTWAVVPGRALKCGGQQVDQGAEIEVRPGVGAELFVIGISLGK